MALIHRFPVSKCDVYTIHLDHDFSEAGSHLGAVSLMPERYGVDHVRELPCRIRDT